MKFLYPCLTLVAIILLSGSVTAQNMVPNGDFEAYTACPTTYSQATNCIGWRSYHGGSSDYFNTCVVSTSTVGIPANAMGYQSPASGNAYMGGVTYASTNYKEYIARDIIPLTIGVTYQVSISVNLATTCGYGTSDIGVWFYDNGPATTITSVAGYIPVTPQVSFASYGPILDSTNWVRLVGTFTADSAYDNIVIGGFGSPTTTGQTATGFPPAAYAGAAYYYIDSVVVKVSDDIKLNFTDSIFCAGDTVKVPFTVINSTFFSTSNVFSLQLSGPTGSFASPTTLATITGNTADTFKYIIPSTITPGNGYRIRIKTSSPVDSTPPNAINIAIGNTIPGKPFAGNNGPVCAGNTLLLSANSSTAGVSYKWTSPANFTSNVQNPSINGVTTAAAGQYIVTARLFGCMAKDTTIVAVVNAAGSVSNTSNSPVCENDTLKLFGSLTAGTAASYKWNCPNGFHPAARDTFIAKAPLLASGDYILTVTLTAGCIVRDTLTVLVKPQPQNFIVTSNSPVCQGNTLSFTAGTTSPGVTYSWVGPGTFTSGSSSPSISNVQPSRSGKYYLTATLNGCNIRDTENVSVMASPPTPVPTANTPVCVGQTLNLNAGVAAPGYLWSGPSGYMSTALAPSIPNANAAVAGDYVVRTVDGGCYSALAGIKVLLAAAPVANMYPSPKDSLCQGAPVTFKASASNAGTSPIYRWYHNNTLVPGATNAGYTTATAADFDTYFCTATSNGTCATPYTDSSNPITLRVFPWLAPSVGIITAPTGTVNGGDLLSFVAIPVNGGLHPLYQWQHNNQNVQGATSYIWGATTLSDKDLVCVSVTSSYMCPLPPTAGSCVTANINTTGIANTKLMDGVKIYPNPFTSQLIIEGIETGTKIQLFDVLGRIAINSVSISEKDAINTTALPPGTYVLQISTPSGYRTNVKITKE